MNEYFISNTNSFYQSSDYLKRLRLQSLLESAVNFPLVAVYAGAGYGKTHAVYSFLKDYAKDYAAHITWIQFSERDNVVMRFWESHTRMVGLTWPETGDRLLKIGFPDTEEKFLKFEAIRSEVTIPPRKYILVYDDFHLLHNPSIFHFVQRALNNMPPNTTIILISRTVPEINMTGMILRERVFTIYEDTLRFTEDEIAEYFKQLALTVTSRDIHNIYDDTQGWAFAVNLIGRSLRRDNRYERCALEAMKANIFKLIESEVFLRISEPLRRFLLRVSLIDHLAADLIKALAADEELIEEMKRLHAYIRYDSFLNAYVIHHLFLGFLRQNQHLLTDEEKRETYQKAGIWCEKNGYQSDSLSYYEKSGDWNAIIQIVYSFDWQVPHAMARYILEIFNRIPEKAASSHPLFPPMILKLKISLGMLEEASALAEQYAKEYEARPESPEKNRTLLGIYHAWALLRLIMCPYTNIYDFDDYFRKMDKYSKKSSFIEHSFLANQSIGAWAVIIGESRADAADEYIEAVSRSIPYVSCALNGNMFGFDDLARGELSYFRREINDAEKFLKQALSKARSRNQYDIQHRALFYLMHIAFIHGDLAAANTALESTKELLDEKDYIVRYMTYDITCGFYNLTLGQPDQVPCWLKTDYSLCAHPALLENFTNRVRAQYHYQTRQYSILLAFIEEELKRQVTLFGRIELNVLAALSLYQLKQKDKAIAALYEAYTLAEPNNIIMPFIHHRKDMRTLTSAVMRGTNCPIPKPWLEDTNRKASALAKKQARMLSEYKAENNLKGETSLTKRETEILKELSQGLSRTEIAVSQNISANTVKMVLNIIYDKLQANNLVDAVRIAVERKII